MNNRLVSLEQAIRKPLDVREYPEQLENSLAWLWPRRTRWSTTCACSTGE